MVRIAKYIDTKRQLRDIIVLSFMDFQPSYVYVSCIDEMIKNIF